MHTLKSLMPVHPFPGHDRPLPACGEALKPLLANSMRSTMSFKAQSLDYLRKDFAYRYHIGDTAMCAKTYAAIRQLAGELISESA